LMEVVADLALVGEEMEDECSAKGRADTPLGQPVQRSNSVDGQVKVVDGSGG
jgi:hypothetical protein